MHAYADAGQESAVDRAFERLYRRYAKDVYRYTLAVLRNPSDAEDVTQTTFLNAYRAFKRGEEPLKPHHWLIRIAHNACRSRYVRIARRPVEVPLDEQLAHVPVATSDVDVRDVLAALAELPFNQRSALVLRELDGRSYREIAETLDVTVPAVETLIFRARRRLRADRAALRVLGAVPLPPSLVSFVEGGGAVASGGAFLGSGLALKVALMLAAGVVAGGIATKELKPRDAVARTEPATAPRLSDSATLAPPGARVPPAFRVQLLRSVPERQALDGPGARAFFALRIRSVQLPVGARYEGPLVAVGERERSPVGSGGGTSAPGAASSGVAPASTSASQSAGTGVSAAAVATATQAVDTSPVSAVTSTVADATSGVTSTPVPPAVATVPSPESVVQTVTSAVPPLPPPPKLP